jgi:hypothetical protein
MNNKGAAGIIIIILLLIGVVTVTYVVLKPNPSPSPTGASVSSGANSNYNPNNPYNIPEYQNTGKGDYGQACLDDGYCDSGECQGGMCVHCGYFGEACCYQDVAGTQCERGSECYLGRCRATQDYTQDCGHVGYKPCYYNEYAKCYYGVYNPSSDICEACGDYEQPCCQDTSYECDYGQCINGRCKRVNQQQTNTQNNANTNSQPNPQDYPIDSQTQNNQPTDSNADCGDLDGACCETGLYQDSWGSLRNDKYCNSGLECYSDVCVNGPEYESYTREDNY